MNNLQSALELTVVGMGMTFLSIGALALGMYLMTILLRAKGEAPSPKADREEQDMKREEEMQSYRSGELPSADVCRRAAAAAVAVAMAVAASGKRQPTREPGGYPPAHETWNGFARSRHLSGRLQYEARRSRR